MAVRPALCFGLVSWVRLAPVSVLGKTATAPNQAEYVRSEALRCAETGP